MNRNIARQQAEAHRNKEIRECKRMAEHVIPAILKCIDYESLRGNRNVSVCLNRSDLMYKVHPYTDLYDAIEEAKSTAETWSYKEWGVQIRSVLSRSHLFEVNNNKCSSIVWIGW